MTQARRPAGIPTGGQFAPINRPAAVGLDLRDDGPDDTGLAGDLAAGAPVTTTGADGASRSPRTSYRQANTVREGSRSPWGTVDYVSPRAVGITDVATPGHGGVKLSAERNRAVHEAWRRPGGWYEEDCEWAIVAMTFPDAFAPEHADVARSTARHYFPDEYEIVTGERIKPGESYVRDRRELRRDFYAAHSNDLVTRSAIGISGEGSVERVIKDGVAGDLMLVRSEQRMVKVTARVGGDGSTDTKIRAFLVPEDDYATRGRFGFVVDPDKYDEVVP
ncbi:MAG: DUF7007 domain-containing protein [Acidimicrobiales bacterium]